MRNFVPSPYIFCVPTVDGSMRIANIATGEILELEREEAEAFNACEDSCGDFQRHALLVKDPEIARQNVLNRHREACRHPAVFNLTLLPTLACNLACVYCFEQNPPHVRMSDTVADAVLALVHREALRHLRVEVAWFGGEPLLEMERILTMQKQIRDVCEKVDCEFRANITTNGYYLDKQNASLLVASGISSFHVTLDGERAVHDAHRPTKSGCGSFDRIFANVINFLETFNSERILIRVNSRPEFAGSILEVLGDIPEGHRSRVTIHLDQIMDSCRIMHLTPQWTREVMDVSLSLRGLGFSSSNLDLCCDPAPAVYCYAERVTSVVVDPRGWIYRCACTNFSEDERVGVLRPDGTVIQSGDFLHEFDKLTALEPSECMSCEFLPVCGFGCPRSRREKRRYPGCRDRFLCIMENMLANGWVGSKASYLL